MTYTDVINVTESEIDLRPPWNQGDHHIIAPGASIPCPESWLPWAARRGLVTADALDAAWKQSGLEAQLEADAAADPPPVDEPARPLPPTAGVMFDSKPKKGRR